MYLLPQGGAKNLPELLATYSTSMNDTLRYALGRVPNLFLYPYPSTPDMLKAACQLSYVQISENLGLLASMVVDMVVVVVVVLASQPATLVQGTYILWKNVGVCDVQ